MAFRTRVAPRTSLVVLAVLADVFGIKPAWTLAVLVVVVKNALFMVVRLLDFARFQFKRVEVEFFEKIISGHGRVFTFFCGQRRMGQVDSVREVHQMRIFWGGGLHDVKRKG